MPTYSNLRVAPPKSWDEFEAIVCSAAKNRWKNPDFTLHGRQGQPQRGVDVYGNSDKGMMVGLQCKNTWSGLSLATIISEVAKAQHFTPGLSHFYVATTAETDEKLQEEVRKLSEQRTKAGNFGVSILFWTDVWSDLCLEESRLFQHYPQLKPSDTDAALEHDRKLYADLQEILCFDPAIRLLRDHDFGGSFLRSAIKPLFNFYETWDQPEKEFIDKELRAGLKVLYLAAADLSNHITGKTVPVGCGDYASVFSDQLRSQGPRPTWVIEEARILNEQATKFVPLYENFIRLCRDKLVGC